MQFLVTSGPRPFLTPRSTSQRHHSSIRAAQEPGVAQHRPDRDLRPASPSDLAADSSYVAPLPFQASVRTPSPALSFCARFPRLRRIPGTPAMRSGKTRRPESPSPSRSPFPAPSHLPVASSALRMPRETSTTKSQADLSSGTPETSHAGDPPPREHAAGASRRRPTHQLPCAVRSGTGARD